MKKPIAVALSLMVGLSCSACAGGGGPSVDEPSDKVIVSVIRTAENGNTYLEVDGQPFAYFGVEARLDAYMNCEKRPVEDFEPYVRAAAELGATVIAVPLDWNDLEPQKDDYDFRIVAAVLGYANKYDIKVEFCWYSINMCGDSNSYQVPAYIWEDEATYPKYESSNKNTFWGYYGYQGYLQPSEALMERETKMINALMDYVYNYDQVNGQKHPLIGIQVYNEPDGFPRWRLSQYSVSLNGQRITEQQAWDAVCTTLDNAGKAFKAAKYNVYTRTNLTTLSEVSDFVRRIYELEGIDAVGNDPYMQSIGSLRSALENFREGLPGNFNHIAENKGSYTNTPGLLLTAAANGAGYMIYDLSTPQYFIDNTSDPTTIDHGVLNVDLTDREHTEAVRRTLKALAAAGNAVMLADRENFAVFNTEASYPETAYEHTATVGGVSVTFTTAAGAVGFAIAYEGYVYLFATEETNVVLGGTGFSEAEYGAFEGGTWVSAGAAEGADGGYALKDGKLCRVKLA